MSILIVSLFYLFFPVNGEISLPQWFGDHMVLQYNHEYGARSFLNGMVRRRFSDKNESLEYITYTQL